MKILASIIFTFICLTWISGQEIVYKSSSSMRSTINYETASKERQIIFTETQIKITNFLNGGKDTLNLDIEKSENKKYSFEGNCKWIYCHSTKMDEITQEYTKYIVITPLSKYFKTINIYQIKDEVTIYHTKLLLN